MNDILYTRPFWFDKTIKKNGYTYNIFRFIGYHTIVLHIEERDKVFIIFENKGQVIPFNYEEFVQMKGWEDSGDRNPQILKNILLNDFKNDINEKDDKTYYDVAGSKENFLKLYNKEAPTHILATDKLLDYN